MDDTEQQIRERAFQLWEEAGCPEGRAEEFWHWACALQLEETRPTEQQMDETDAASFPASDPPASGRFT